MEEPPFHKFLHISQNHRPVSIIAHARKAQMVLNSHRNRTVNRSCQTAFGLWLYLFAKTPTLCKRDTYLGAL